MKRPATTAPGINAARPNDEEKDNATSETGRPPPAHAPFARGIRGAAAVLITLVAPVISMSGALTTGLKGTSPAVGFPPGYGATLVATIAATTKRRG